jgi:hypothetical protein
LRRPVTRLFSTPIAEQTPLFVQFLEGVGIKPE